MRSAGEQAKVARMLRRRRMMQKFRGITFHNSIDVMHTKLTLINKEPICRRVAFEKRDSSFDSPNPADERPDQQRDDAATASATARSRQDSRRARSARD